MNTEPRTGRLIVVSLLAAAAGVYAGARWHEPIRAWLLPAPTAATPAPPPAGSAPDAAPAAARGELWTCGMHPQVIQDHPGDCPICHMKLTPVTARAAGPGGSAMVTIDPAVVQNMGVRTAAARAGAITRRVRAAATIAEPDTARVEVNLRIAGWVESLAANTEGAAVRKGEPLLTLSSPDLRVAIDEFIAATRTEGVPGLASAAESRLRALGLSAEQVASFRGMDQAPELIAIPSPIDGHVVEKGEVYAGSAVMAGQKVMVLADRRTMWVEGRVPESRAGLLREGQRGVARVEALGPGAPPVEGTVRFIHPHLDDMSRTVLVRMEVPNENGVLRRGMFATLELEAAPGETGVLVPREAVIDTGSSRLVFVALGEGKFDPRRVEAGATGDDGSTLILSGVRVGEQVVTSGQFLLDSESRVREAIAKFQSPDAPPPAPAPRVRSTPELGEKVAAAVAAYLEIEETLGGLARPADPAAVEGLIAACRALEEAARGTGAEGLAAAARRSAEAMRGVDQAGQREAFKAASAAMIAVVDAAPPEIPLWVVNCPMVKADWLQKSEAVANPYYAEEMKECGSVVRRVTPAGGAR